MSDDRIMREAENTWIHAHAAHEGDNESDPITVIIVALQSAYERGRREERERLEVGESEIDGDLLPCPHCGGKAKSFDYIPTDGPGGTFTSWITCECGAGTPLYEKRAKAVAQWNRRTSPSAALTARKEENNQ